MTYLISVIYEVQHQCMQQITSALNIVHRPVLIMGTCRQCGSSSVTGYNHRKVVGWDHMVHQRLGMTREMETWLSDSGVSNNSVISVVLVMRLHCCCHLLNKVENITWTPYIPSALNRLRGAVKLLFPRGRSGPSLIHGFFPHQSPVFSGLLHVLAAALSITVPVEPPFYGHYTGQPALAGISS